ncbi:hypothetical protein EVJ20_07080 [Exiguobacterium sp. SH0S1]|uniref:hypothetical protein n=1 Tax=Exiguobacterium sp. SH0S1 TaxID=2510949 RepID=UPI0010400217|nr:hypothetical protein [Exiguobacterium sp. SH0S1]TCI77718.1 hypothetical protein EVJ20_07080 [Exiguobacterium sp. SH0S1]
MNKKLALIFNLLFFPALLMGCFQNEDIVRNNSSVDIIVSNYFPEVGLERTYIEYGKSGETLISNDTVKLEIDSSGDEVLYIHAKDGIAGERIVEYEVSKNSIKKVYIINAIFNKKIDELELTNQRSWSTGDSDNALRYLTDDKLEVTVPAGIFQECIEVTEVFKSKEYIYTSIYYYAPKIGLIKTVFEVDDERFTYTELQSFSNGTEQTKEFESNTQEKSSGIEEAPSPQLKSGDLPPDTNLTSSLNINDYVNLVNQHSIKQVNYNLLHRPTFEETENEVILYFTEDIKIRHDINGNIKEVFMKQDSMLDEEKLFYIQWLILGLDPQMTLDEVNEIIFPKEPNDFFEVGEFYIGIKTDSNGFTFKATPK